MSRVLIDTQALIWFAEASPRLTTGAIELVNQSRTTRVASVASVWEMAIKMALGKLDLPRTTLARFVESLPAMRVTLLPITADDALRVVELPLAAHKDPFDRLIAAQCLRRDLTLVSSDPAFDAYGVRRVW